MSDRTSVAFGIKKMPIITACCCYESLKHGSRGSAFYTFITGLINACISIWLIATLHKLQQTLEWNEQWNFLPPGMLVFMCIQLACNFGMFALAFLLGVGINRLKICRILNKQTRTLDGQGLIWLWVVGITGFRVYEVFIGMYTLIWLGAHRIGDVLFVAPYFIFVIFYWVFNTVLMIVAIICVVSFLQERTEEVFGKADRIKYFQMLSNVRAAALKSRGVMRSGTATPRSFYGSRPTLTASQASLGGARNYPPSSQQSYGHPSTSSYPEKEHPQQYGQQQQYAQHQQQQYYGQQQGYHQPGGAVKY